MINIFNLNPLTPASAVEEALIPVLATTLYYYVLKGIHKLLINITEIVDIYRNELSLT